MKTYFAALMLTAVLETSIACPTDSGGKPSIACPTDSGGKTSIACPIDSGGQYLHVTCFGRNEYFLKL